MQRTFDFDICRNRHRGSPESVAANPSQEHKRQSHERILALLVQKKMTGKEIADAMNVPFNTISGRCSEMKALKLIRKTGVRRDGAAELEIVR